ncbi:MAG: CHASE2 domain-containing protein [Nitrospinales bacterium]
MNIKKIIFSPFYLSLLIVLLFVGLFFLNLKYSIIEPLEWKVLDLRYKIRGPLKFEPKVVIVNIDENSMEHLGAWPWPRSYFGDLITVLSQSGAALVGFDVIFAEEEHSLGKKVFTDLLEQYKSLDLDKSTTNGRIFFQVLMDLEDGLNHDLAFANATEAAGNVVHAMFFDYMKKESEEKRTYNQEVLEAIGYPSFKDLINNPEDIDYFPILKASSLTLPIFPLAQTAVALAHVNAITDADGGLRWETLLTEYNGEVFPSFSLLLAIIYSQAENIGIVLGDGINLEQNNIPMNDQARMLINYQGGTGAFPYYSFVEILQGEVPPENFEGKIVLVGSTVTGLHDTYVTPFSQSLPGVEKHAAVIQNILDQQYLKRSSWVHLIDLGALIILGVLLSWILPKSKNLWGLLVVLCAIAGYFYAAQYMFEKKGIWINTVLPLTEAVVIFIGTTLCNYLAERKQRVFVKSAFSQYLAPAVVNQLIKNPERLQLGGERKILTAFFSDVAGFSTLSEKLSPQDVVELLNIYLTEMTDIILKYEGTVDKYEGDAIIAFFGAPISYEDHAKRACWVSVEMQQRLVELREQWKAEGKQQLFVRIGLNTGPMVVGNMGSKTRMDYTMMGDSVNLAARLEGAGKQYKVFTIISEFTYEQAREFIEVRELDSIRVVGKSEAVKIYELLGKTGELSETQRKVLAHFNEGLQNYKLRQWEKAISCFEEALGIDETDGPSLTYFERCLTFQSNPPSESWDGVFAMTSK